ncbi:MFS transporter [Haloferax sp. Atlit-6N]|uniref:Major facilitator superfamily transport protein n=1 Tax=Haloferax gibbonsii TaxID=35746 RepID=A0A871BKL0_HALGI|nr:MULTISPECIES: MFS transporter [Haloferax]QOS13621.1 major facilitator superfamily transport protein [Haloferax gibbonsii]RDZ51319.1 MFS transporter [Haloferax sp. Atlit-4N]REA02881.1 MFS transporter [Haloferax sp. Atlit-6N]
MNIRIPRAKNEERLVLGSVIVSTFFIGFGGGVIFPILPNLGAILGISPFLVGMILSANRFSRLFANAPAGSLVDRFGTRKPFVIGMFVQGISTLGYVIAMIAPLPEAWFMTARILWGVGSALVFATAYTIADDISDGGSRGSNMGLIRGGVLFGFPTGVVLGGLVSEFSGDVVAFAVATAFAFFASVVAYQTVPETHVDGGANQSVKPWEINKSLPAVTVGLVNFAVLFVYIGALFATLVLFLDQNQLSVFGFDAQGTSGLFMGLTVLAAGLSMYLGGRVSDQAQSRVPVLLLFLGVTSIGFLLLALADSAWMLVLACVCIGLGQGGTSGPLMALLGDLVADGEMGRAVGTNNVLGDVGGGFGPIVTLPIVEAVGFWPVYFCCAVMPLIAAVVLLLGVRRETGRFLPSVDS